MLYLFVHERRLSTRCTCLCVCVCVCVCVYVISSQKLFLRAAGFISLLDFSRISILAQSSSACRSSKTFRQCGMLDVVRAPVLCDFFFLDDRQSGHAPAFHVSEKSQPLRLFFSSQIFFQSDDISVISCAQVHGRCWGNPQ